MSNFLRKQRDELLQAELDELEGTSPAAQEEIKNETVIEGNAEEETFRKRYGDLRRHLQKLENDWRSEKTELQTKIQERQVSLPKTEEELAAWAGKYPDLYKIFETMIMKRETEATQKITKELSELRATSKKKESLSVLLQAHPDFPNIAQDMKFHDWLKTKSKHTQDIMYEDGADPYDAIDVVTMYKALTNPKEEKPKVDGRKQAAETIPSSNRSAPAFEGEHVFSESDVAQMNERDYLKHEAEISKQIASGKFKYDVSGAAR